MTSTNAQLRPNSIKSWWGNPYMRILSFVLAYFFAIYIGLTFVTAPEKLTAIWPASGVALAALLLSPRREWPAILALIFVIDIFSYLVSGNSLPFSAESSLVNTIESALAGWLVLWLRKNQQVTFTKLADVLSLTLVAILSNALTTSLDALISAAILGVSFTDTWLTWWILDGLSILAITPFLVTWARSETSLLGDMTPNQLIESIIWLTILCASTWFMFGMSGVDIYVEQRPYMLYPFLVWGALRFSPRASVTALLLTSAIALVGTLAGTGTYPLGGNTAREHLVAVQGFFAVACITILLLSATITERRGVEKNLAERNLFIESIVNISPDVLYIYDIFERQNVYSNDGIQRILGYSTKELQDMGEQLIPSLMHPDDFEVYLQEIFPKYMQAKDSELITHQYRMKHRDGGWRILESDELIYLRNPDGSPRQVFGVLRDITERKQAEERIESQNRLMNTLLDNLQVGVFMIEAPTGKPLLSNLRATELLGRGIHPEADQTTLAEVYEAYKLGTGELYPQNEMPVVRGLLGEESMIDDMLVIHPDGESVLLEVVGSPVQDDKGNTIASLVSFTDITERKRTEAERERLLDELERKNEELESLVYVASHDLRSPLVNLQGFGQNLQNHFIQVSGFLQNAETLDDFRTNAQSLLKERIPKALHFIESSTMKMDSLISGLLRVSRAGRTVLQIEPVDMAHMLHDILDSMAFQIKKAGAWIKLEEPLTPCQGDQNQLNQVFSNLLDNALKYRDPNRPLTITISSKVESRMVIYVIADTGIGISAGDQKKIWELFRRLDVDESISGEGLGLTLARRIVERHGGKLWVESDPGVGSKFYVELPAIT